MNFNFIINQMYMKPYFLDQIAQCSEIWKQGHIYFMHNKDLKEFFLKYCLCDLCVSDSISNLYYNQSYFMTEASINEFLQNEYALSIGSSSKTALASSQYHKRRLLDTIDFQPKIVALLSTIKRVENESKVIVYGKSIARLLVSNRRSHYTGVFKNGGNRQALISIQKRKTYIGTYTNKLEAAKVFDFYSILLNGITATTNFDYTKMDIVEMIENYISNDGKYIYNLNSIL